MHALAATEKGSKNDKSIAKDAERLGRKKPSVKYEMYAAEIPTAVIDVTIGAFDGSPEKQIAFLEKLIERSFPDGETWQRSMLHPEHCWPVLAQHLLKNKWTVEPAEDGAPGPNPP
jgi:hypothetical protein